MAPRVFNTSALRVGCFSYQRDPGAHRLSVIVKGTFAMEHAGTARLLDAQPELTGNAQFDDHPDASLRYPSDWAPFKPRADAMLVGTCHLPDGLSRGVGKVRLRVGKMAKALTVLGERQWGGLDKPKPFRTMPLRYERAFGGAEHPDNPVGTGLAAGKPPNIELPHALMKTQEDRPSVAGVGPIDVRWRERTQKSGTFDQKWLAERWPWFPQDFDWSFFNAAPADQQIHGYLRGDEPVVCAGLHSRVASYETSLPGLRPRAFVKSPEGIAEVALVLDTLWIDMDAEELVLVWRGSANIADKWYRDVEGVALALEHLADPAQPAEVYHDAKYWAPTPEPEEAEELETDEPPPEPEPAPTEEAKDEDPLDLGRRMLKEGSAPEALIRKLEGVTDLDEFKKILLEAMPPPDSGDAEKVKKEQADAEAETRRVLLEQGLDPKVLDEEPPDPVPPEGGRLTRDELIERYAAGHSLAAVDLSGLDLSGLDLHDANLTGANLSATRLAGTRLSGAMLKEANLRGVSGGDEIVDFAGANLEEAKLDGAELPRANFAGADLTGASLQRAKLPGASVKDATLERADLLEADLTGADFSGATGAGAVLRGAMLGGTNFSGADFDGADLCGAKLERARMSDASFENATFGDALLHAVTGERVRMRGADLTGVDLRDAVFDGAFLAGCVLERARLDGASLRDATVDEARGEDVVMSGADLTGLRARGCNFPKGQFERTKADGSNWAGAVLERGAFTEATLERADFSDAKLDKTRFHRAVLKHGTFMRASLAGATLTKVNLFKGSLDSADLSGADCRDSSFFECNLTDAVTEKTRFERTNLKRTILGARRG